jgi:UDP-N-acetylglucosamine acyltransferase
VPKIHPLAIIDPGAEIGRNVTIGPLCVVESGAVIGDDCQFASRVVIKSRTTLGRGNVVSEGTVLGGSAQHAVPLEPGGHLVIGDNNRIRENCTIHRAYANEAVTTIGDNNLLMVGAHIAHDCTIGNNCFLVNNCMLAGHVTVEDRAYISGGVGIHQFCRIGKLAILGALARIVQDVPPYVMVEGGGASQIVGLNKVGLRRAGYTSDEVQQLKAAYRVIYRQGLRWSEVLQILKTEFATGPAAAFYEFLKTGKRGFTQERRISRKATLKLADVPLVEVDANGRSAQDRDAA